MDYFTIFSLVSGGIFAVFQWISTTYATKLEFDSVAHKLDKIDSKIDIIGSNISRIDNCMTAIMLDPKEAKNVCK